ncbi:MAG: amidohydrolase family protein [Pseudomonadota bacterium]|nr:amidohydrolase family protein [Pseudomonadota bacterium]
MSYRVLIRSHAWFLGICIAAGVICGAQAQNKMLFQDASLIIGDGRVLTNHDLLIEDGLIVSLGENLPPPDTGLVVDLQGKWVMPALIDAHAHLGFQSRQSWGADNYELENLTDNLEQYAYYGFGAVFSAGSDPAEIAQLLAATVRRRKNLPEFLYAAGLAPPGEGPNNQFLEQTSQVQARTGYQILYGLTDPESARQTVTDLALKGFEFLKIWVDDRGGSQTKLAPEIYRAVAQHAGEAGLKVFVHQQSASDMQDLISAGVDGFLHGRIGRDFTDELIERAVQSDVFVIPNLGLGELRREAIGEDQFLTPFLSQGLRESLSASERRQVHPERDATNESELIAGFARIEVGGLDLVLGTDAGAVPGHPFGYTGHRELEIYVRLGMSPMDALRSATSLAAKHLGLRGLGLLEPGKQASLLILNSDPTSDIRNTRDIHSVYLNGQPVDRSAIASRTP